MKVREEKKLRWDLAALEEESGEECGCASQRHEA